MTWLCTYIEAKTSAVAIGSTIFAEESFKMGTRKNSSRFFPICAYCEIRPFARPCYGFWLKEDLYRRLRPWNVWRLSAIQP